MEPLSLNLEKSLLDLHNSIALTSPSLLPLVTKLGAEVRNERKSSLRQKIGILQKFRNNQGKAGSDLNKTTNRSLSTRTPGSTKKKDRSQTGRNMSTTSGSVGYFSRYPYDEQQYPDASLSPRGQRRGHVAMAHL